MSTRSRQRDSFTCPNCGEDVPAGAASCPECGADDDTGWSDMTDYDGMDVPALDEEEDDEPWSPAKEERATHVGSLWKLIALVLAIILALLALLNVW